MTIREWRVCRFSLRALLLAVTILAVCLGYGSRTAIRQRQAVIAVKGVGGRVFYDFQVRNREDFWATRPIAEWLNDRSIAIDWLADVIEVDLTGCSGTAVALDYVVRLPRLGVLYLRESDVTDQDMARVGVAG